METTQRLRHSGERATVCVLTPRQALLLQEGVVINLSKCRRITHEQALLLVQGAQHRARSDDDYLADLKANKSQPQISSRYFPIAEWLTIGEREYRKYIVLRVVFEWQVRNGVKQLLAPGTTRQRRRHTRMHVIRPVSYSATQCADVNGTQAGIPVAQEVAANL